MRLTGHESSSIETETESNAVSFEHRSITLLPIERMRNVESASVLNTIEYGVKPEKKQKRKKGKSLAYKVESCIEISLKLSETDCHSYYFLSLSLSLTNSLAKIIILSAGVF